MKLTILMPCLNEEKTIKACIEEVRKYIDGVDFDSEILVVDNNSTDHSATIAKDCGARVIACDSIGYGSALICGINNAHGDYIIYGDCDMSYDFTESNKIMECFEAGAILVAGNRFHPHPVKEAMSFSHRLGVPMLSFIGRLRYKVKVKDFHCGLRGIKADEARKLKLSSPGMEFATEIIAKSKVMGYKISEVDITLRPDGRGKPSHLNTIKDGFRHLKYMLRS